MNPIMTLDAAGTERGAGPAGKAGGESSRLMVEDLVRRGREMLRLFDTEGYEEAVSLFREAIEAAPAHAPAYAGLAETYAYWGFRQEIDGLQGQEIYDMSHEYASMALGLAPEIGEAHRAMALALRRGDRADPERRKKEALIALDLDPDNAETWYEYWRACGYNPSDPAVHKILELGPGLCGPHIDLGAVYYGVGRHADALAEFLQALRINPRNSLAHYDMAMVLHAEGRPDKAKEVLLKARQMHPEDPLVEYGLQWLEQ